MIGRTDIEDALKRLDKLTQEEARMAVAQNLKATHAVDERVRGVADTVADVDDRVAGVDDRVARVDNSVACVDDKVTSVNDKVASLNDKMANVNDRVASVDDNVKVVDDKVTEIIYGVEIIFDQASGVLNGPLRWEGNKASHKTNGQRCRSSETFVISF